jgi:hypothetical protein
LFSRIWQWVHVGLCTDTVVKTRIMKTSTYNPSSLEVDFANALQILREDIQKHLQNNQITNVENHVRKDNPMVRFNLVDKDGDPHEIVVRIIQIPDKF